eukprot:2725415-Rhodomonas_salina.1
MIHDRKRASRNWIVSDKHPQLIRSDLSCAERECVCSLRNVSAVASNLLLSSQASTDTPLLVHPVLKHLSVEVRACLRLTISVSERHAEAVCFPGDAL